jgi:hypothetical protein
MANTPIISLQDLLEVMPIAEIPQERIDQYICEAQELDLRPVLNDALYYDFMLKYNTVGDPMYTAYQNLLNGTTWLTNGVTVQFCGVKPMLARYALARFIPMNGVNVTRYGNHRKLNDKSEAIEQTSITYVVNNMRSAAIAYQNQVTYYLQMNPSTYPLYARLPDKSVNKTGMSFFSSRGPNSRPFGWYDGVFYS